MIMPWHEDVEAVPEVVTVRDILVEEVMGMPTKLATESSQWILLERIQYEKSEVLLGNSLTG